MLSLPVTIFYEGRHLHTSYFVQPRAVRTIPTWPLRHTLAHTPLIAKMFPHAQAHLFVDPCRFIMRVFIAIRQSLRSGHKLVGAMHTGRAKCATTPTHTSSSSTLIIGGGLSPTTCVQTRLHLSYALVTHHNHVSHQQTLHMSQLHANPATNTRDTHKVYC